MALDLGRAPGGGARGARGRAFAAALVPASATSSSSSSIRAAKRSGVPFAAPDLRLKGFLPPRVGRAVASAAAALAPSASVPVAFARKDGGARRDEAARRRHVKREGRKRDPATGRPNVTSAAANAREAKLGEDDDDAVASVASARRSAAIVARRIVRCSRRARVASAERP